MSASLHHGKVALTVHEHDARAPHHPPADPCQRSSLAKRGLGYRAGCSTLPPACNRPWLPSESHTCGRDALPPVLLPPWVTYKPAFAAPGPAVHSLTTKPHVMTYPTGQC
jgi:hypothetical protein